MYVAYFSKKQRKVAFTIKHSRQNKIVLVSSFWCPKKWVSGGAGVAVYVGEAAMQLASHCRNRKVPRLRWPCLCPLLWVQSSTRNYPGGISNSILLHSATLSRALSNQGFASISATGKEKANLHNKLLTRLRNAGQLHDRRFPLPLANASLSSDPYTSGQNGHHLDRKWSPANAGVFDVCLFRISFVGGERSCCGFYHRKVPFSVGIKW